MIDRPTPQAEPEKPLKQHAKSTARMILHVACLMMLVLPGGCASGNYARSVHGTTGGYSMRNVRPTAPSLMVARKIERPLYIVLDATKVKDTWPLATAPCATAATGCERFSLLDFHEFVRRDLKNTMSDYFSRVELVTSHAELPTTPHVIADVKVDDIRLNALVRGIFTHQIIEMTWGFALRNSGQDDYAYSFAGVASSNDSYPTFEAGLAQLVENAIPTMLKKWTDAGGFDAMRNPPE